LNPWPPQC